jgi:hypothetical protein
MLVIRPTLKLASQLRLKPQADVDPAPDPGGDWCVRAFQVRRTRYLLFTHIQSLFSVIAPRRGVVNGQGVFEALHRALEQFLHAAGHPALWEQKLEPLFVAPPMVFATNRNRSLVGSINDLEFMAKAYLESPELDFVEVQRRLNSAPMGALNMDSPAEVFLGGRIRTR